MAKTKEELEEIALLTLLKHSGSKTYADIRDLVDDPNLTLASTLLILVAEGKVEKKRVGPNDPFVYSLILSDAQKAEILASALAKINRTIFDVGAPLGSHKYFEIRSLCVDTLRELDLLDLYNLATTE